ncbi:HAD family hydrolase [Novosphingobium album (ex Liu et al. 2023)]|uniref:HAD family hydrolase n=1 Tax=Novosphingobium album (ex Liu et al. 2023) TaxID=3031130 RepID=A0ABT5WLM8_9SPHN|nr:HAD family hydrolase [Novosphingobium album (ex Liu et al. 2023)]MDE8650789.1 HAD family hydrolase [Novosphingobium album (ex Liu et al. 2023)]
MSRPLIVSDCDEVLLYMVTPFRDWLAEEQGVDFTMAGNDFARAMRHRDSGAPVAEDEIWRLLNLFFDGQMHRQSPVAGAVEAIARLGEHADIVVLTNLKDFRQEARTRQLAEHGIPLRVFTNQGPKGPALKAILDEYAPSRAIFIDDLAQHHDSVSESAPHVARLHLCAEPKLAPHIACAHAAGHAHARIDDWAIALPWLLDRLHHEKETDEI